MRYCLTLSLCLVFCLLSGCIYGNVVTPLDTDVAETELGSKVGKASIHSILYLFAWGDAGTEAAARDGDIHVITHLDEEYRIVLFGLYTRNTTIAYGR